MYCTQGGLLGADIRVDGVVCVVAPTGHQYEGRRRADDGFELRYVLVEHDTEQRLARPFVHAVHTRLARLRPCFEYSPARQPYGVEQGQEVEVEEKRRHPLALVEGSAAPLVVDGTDAKQARRYVLAARQGLPYVLQPVGRFRPYAANVRVHSPARVSRSIRSRMKV